MRSTQFFRHSINSKRPWHHNRFLSACYLCFSFQLYFLFFVSYLILSHSSTYCIVLCAFHFILLLLRTTDDMIFIYVIYHVLSLSLNSRKELLVLLKWLLFLFWLQPLYIQFTSFSSLATHDFFCWMFEPQKIQFRKIHSLFSLAQREIEREKDRDGGFKSRKIGKINLYCACWMCMSRELFISFFYIL